MTKEHFLNVKRTEWTIVLIKCVYYNNFSRIKFVSKLSWNIPVRNGVMKNRLLNIFSFNLVINELINCEELSESHFNMCYTFDMALMISYQDSLKGILRQINIKYRKFTMEIVIGKTEVWFQVNILHGSLRVLATL